MSNVQATRMVKTRAARGLCFTVLFFATEGWAANRISVNHVPGYAPTAANTCTLENAVERIQNPQLQNGCQLLPFGGTVDKIDFDGVVLPTLTIPQRALLVIPPIVLNETLVIDHPKDLLIQGPNPDPQTHPFVTPIVISGQDPSFVTPTPSKRIFDIRLRRGQKITLRNLKIEYGTHMTVPSQKSNIPQTVGGGGIAIWTQGPWTAPSAGASEIKLYEIQVENSQAFSTLSTVRDKGGAIHFHAHFGKLSITSSNLEYNRAAFGAGVAVEDVNLPTASSLKPFLEMHRSRVLYNWAEPNGLPASGSGAGVWMNTDGLFRLMDIDQNIARRYGGGIYQIPGPNQASNLDIVNSGITANRALIKGGGFYVEDPKLMLFNSTISQNIAQDPFQAEGQGGGIWASMPLRMSTTNRGIFLGHVSLLFNQAASGCGAFPQASCGGAGLYLDYAAAGNPQNNFGTVEFSNTILSANTSKTWDLAAGAWSSNKVLDNVHSNHLSLPNGLGLLASYCFNHIGSDLSLSPFYAIAMPGASNCDYIENTPPVLPLAHRNVALGRCHVPDAGHPHATKVIDAGGFTPWANLPWSQSAPIFSHNLILTSPSMRQQHWDQSLRPRYANPAVAGNPFENTSPPDIGAVEIHPLVLDASEEAALKEPCEELVFSSREDGTMEALQCCPEGRLDGGVSEQIDSFLGRMKKEAHALCSSLRSRASNGELGKGQYRAHLSTDRETDLDSVSCHQINSGLEPTWSIRGLCVADSRKSVSAGPTIYPNPLKDGQILKVRLTKPATHIRVQISSMEGKVLFQKTLKGSFDPKNDVDLGSLEELTTSETILIVSLNALSEAENAVETSTHKLIWRP